MCCLISFPHIWSGTFFPCWPLTSIINIYLITTATLFLTFVFLWTESSEAAKGKSQVKVSVKKSSRIQIKRLKGKGKFPVVQLSNTSYTNSFFVNNQAVCLLCAIMWYVYPTLLIHSAGRKKAKNAKPPTKDKVDTMVEWRIGTVKPLYVCWEPARIAETDLAKVGSVNYLAACATTAWMFIRNYLDLVLMYRTSNMNQVL